MSDTPNILDALKDRMYPKHVGMVFGMQLFTDPSVRTNELLIVHDGKTVGKLIIGVYP